MLRCENLLIKQQLDHQLQTSREKREEEDGTCHDLKRALAEAQALYRSVCEEHEDRTTEMNKAHAKQCEQLCRDVVQAHSEIKRLKNVFPPLTGGSHSIVWSILMLGSSKNSPAKGGRTRYISKRSYLFFLICVGFALYRFNFVPAYKEKETTTDPLNVHELPTSLKALKDTPALALPKIYAKERTEAIELEPENSPKRSIPGSQGKPRLVAWFQSPSQGYYEIHKKGHLEQ